MKSMKKIMQVLTAFSCVLFLCIGTVSMSAFAKSKTATQDGLEVTLSTDKDSYSTSDAIIATLKVKNNNSYAVPNVCLEHYIPNGYSIAEGSDESGTDSLAAGEEITLTVKMVNTPEVTVTIVTEAAFTTTTTTASGEADGTTGSGNSGSTTVSTSTGAGTTTVKSENGPKTGNEPPVLGILAIVAAVAVIIFCVMKKRAGSLLSLVLCAGTVGMMSYRMDADAYDSEEFDEFIAISDTISVGGTNLVIDGVVTYNKPSASQEQTSPEDNFRNKAEQFIGEIDAATSEKLLSEKAVTEMLAARGFTDCDITYSYDVNGTYVGQKEVSGSSDAKHPMYTASYETDEIYWMLYVINDSVFASPLSYNLESDATEVMFSETDQVTSYASRTNKFYVYVPKTSVADVRKIEKINAETIDNIKVEDIEK